MWYNNLNKGDTMILTDEQKHIIDLSKRLNHNEILAIQACAGSGKTSTLREIALANPNAKFLYLAFNKAIVLESKAKFPPNVEVKTIHSLAFGYTRQRLGDFSPVSKLTRFDLDEVLELGDNVTAGAIIRLFDRFLQSDKNFNDDFRDKELIEYLWNAVLNKKMPITHSFYLKYYQLAQDKRLNYDFVLLDEAQDTNATMLGVFLDNNCRKILVGDTFQNIYGFNNSINAFEVINPTHYATLSKSFRCKQQILDYANFLIGKFTDKPFKAMTSGFKENNGFETKAFITRTNAGIVEFINELEEFDDIDNYRLLKEPSKIFAPLWAIIHHKNAKFDLIPREFAYLTKINNTKELFKYIKESQDVELEGALSLLDYDIDLIKVTKLANKLYRNKNATNFIINAHQAKGLEWDIVELSDDFPTLSDLERYFLNIKDADKAELKEKALEQELNLFYVAITRAKRQLIDNSANLLDYIMELKDNSILNGNGTENAYGHYKIHKAMKKELEEAQ